LSENISKFSAIEHHIDNCELENQLIYTLHVQKICMYCIARTLMFNFLVHYARQILFQMLQMTPRSDQLMSKTTVDMYLGANQREQI
jgi:hypothetical protein